MFSTFSSCCYGSNKLNNSHVLSAIKLPSVSRKAVGLDLLTSLVATTFFVLSVTGVLPVGLTGSYILLGVAAFQAAIPLLDLVNTCNKRYNHLPKGYFKNFLAGFFMTKDPLLVTK